MIGTKLAHYDITRHLGSGGMGEVYEASDSRLGRSVAIKLLPGAFARDSERVARLEREARVLASLNHSNIAAIHGLEESEGRNFLVMEYVAGETLAERIARGALGVPETLNIAKQIIEALEAAHEKGIVHRDLKPANIKITPDEKVKVLDFGLAKAFEADSPNPNLSNSPTLSLAATNAGTILGTAAYMSPEQAKGRAVDRRTDIFAFGCVLYEMLTGQPAFDGEDVADIMSRVLQREPDWSRLPASVPPWFQKLMRLCLEKDRRKRRQSVGDIRIDIEQALAEPAVAAPATKDTAGNRSLFAWIGAIAAIGLILALAIPAATHWFEIAPAEMRLQIVTPPTPSPTHFALSPDGRYIVFVASGDGPHRLWLRPLDKTDAQPLSRTESAEFPFWSADSRSIAFFAASKLHRMDISGGQPQVLANAPAGRGGTWNADGTIVFAPQTNGPLMRISASGGEPVTVTRTDPPRIVGHRFPFFLPDGKRFLFYAQGVPEVAGIYLASLEGGEPKRLTTADSAAAFLEPNWVLFVRQGALVAQQLDASNGALTGDQATIADPVGYDANFFWGGFSVSRESRVAYRAEARRNRLTWLDRKGARLGTAYGPESGGLLHAELSPVGSHVAVQRTVQNNMDIWLIDLMRGGLSRFTFDPAFDYIPVWSPDGKRIVFSSTRMGAYDLYVKPSSMVGSDQLILKTPNNKQPQSWSRDGRFLLYFEVDLKTGRDLFVLDMMTPGAKPRPVVNSPFEERTGEFSPDGRWLAYDTNESGAFETVVQPFPEATGKWQVSTTGGLTPRWRADGKELYFIAQDGNLMAATVTISGSTFQFRTPVPLFQTGIGSGALNIFKPQYAVAPDGRFLINQVAEESTATPITLILNWKP